MVGVALDAKYVIMDNGALTLGPPDILSTAVTHTFIAAGVYAAFVLGCGANYIRLAFKPKSLIEEDQ